MTILAMPREDLAVYQLPILPWDIPCSFCIPERAHHSASATEIRFTDLTIAVGHGKAVP